MVSRVPLLTADEPLPALPRRVLVAGTSGSGKTRLAGHIASVLGIAPVEIDSLFHGPGWTPRDSFVADVLGFSAEPDWVTEWQYGPVREVLAERADTLVWLDLSRALVMRQVVRRTLQRRLRRQPLWNGNIEPPLRTIFTDSEHIVRWAWDTHHKSGLRVSALLERRPELVVVRLRDRREISRWLAGPLSRSRDHSGGD